MKAHLDQALSMGRRVLPFAEMGRQRLCSANFYACANGKGTRGLAALEHVPEKLIDFSDENMLQLIDLERFAQRG
ncbi:MAG: hypothetical protein ACYC5H_07480, partial [Methylovirgula sp.]